MFFYTWNQKIITKLLRDWWLPEMGMGGCGVREMSEEIQKV